jgi:hypothetical protein
MESSGEEMSILVRWNQIGEPFRLNQLCNLREGMGRGVHKFTHTLEHNFFTKRAEENV